MNEKQKRFCLEYLKDFNATQAAIRVGYSKRTARQIGHENLTKPDIQKFLAEKYQKFSHENDIEVSQVIRHLKEMTFFDLQVIFDKHGRLRPLNKMSATARRVLNSITLSQSGTMIKVRLPSRERTAELLGRHLGMFKDHKFMDKTHQENRIFVFPGFKPGMPIPTDD